MLIRRLWGRIFRVESEGGSFEGCRGWGGEGESLG